ncbi:MAG: imidazole glycerol phosphate synthase subunit HisH [Candidatus Geothermincolia bacterium]
MIYVIDYGMGNLRSVQKAFEFLGNEVRFATEPAQLNRASALVLPGVGAFDDAVTHLERSGLWEPLLSKVLEGTPFLGICLGYQLLFEGSEEGSGLPGLGLLRGRVRRFGESLKVPHMGWNSVKIRGTQPFFEGVPDGSHFYFVHSYYPEPEDGSIVAATTEYQVEFASAVARDNLCAIQFHPEKSSRAGLRLLSNFARLAGGS